MRLFFDSGVAQKNPPILRTRVLNAEECHVSVVGLTFNGRLCYKKSLLSTPKMAVDHVLVLQSVKHKDMPEECRVEMDFDMYLEDGRVVEVWSCDRKVIQAALKYAPVRDIRETFRKRRRCMNG